MRKCVFMFVFFVIVLMIAVLYNANEKTAIDGVNSIAELETENVLLKE